MPQRYEDHRELVNEQRKADRDIQIPEVYKPDLRRELEQDPERWLSTLFPRRFKRWTPVRSQIREGIAHVIDHGGDQANAYPRGIGKTAITEGEIGALAPVTGRFNYAVVCAANGKLSRNLIGNIKKLYLKSPEFAKFYPEVVHPILALGRSPLKAKQQTYRGEFTDLIFEQETVKLPTIRFCQECLCLAAELVDEVWICESCNRPMGHSAASGVRIDAVGLHQPVRGIRDDDVRPDIIVIDDPDTPESAESDDEIEKRTDRIENDIGGLGGDTPVARVMNTTLQNDKCVSAIYTDPKRKPSWNGRRVGLVSRFPDRKDLWDQYIELRQEGMRYRDDRFGREAHAFYLANREEMDAGGVVIDDERYAKNILPDGSEKESSTIEAVHNAAADKGWDFVLTELQNNPPELKEDDDEGINEGIVRGVAEGYVGRLTGRPKGEVPESCLGLTIFIDCGKRRLTYVVGAWLDQQRCEIIDYAHVPTFNPDVVGENEAVRAALVDLRDKFAMEPYSTAEGHVCTRVAYMVDSGDFTDTVYATVKGFGRDWKVSKGSSRPLKDGKSFEVSFAHGCRFVLMDGDYWKREVHESFLMRPTDESGLHARGATRIFGTDHREHKDFAAEVIAERFVTEFNEGKGIKQGWKKFARDNHFLDCLYGTRCLAAIGRILEGRSIKPPTKKSGEKRPAEATESALFDASNWAQPMVGRGGRPRLRPGGQ